MTEFYDRLERGILAGRTLSLTEDRLSRDCIRLGTVDEQQSRTLQRIGSKPQALRLQGFAASVGTVDTVGEQDFQF